jgi:hypothetical protein
MNYLAKFVEQLFSKSHLDASENAKKMFFLRRHQSLNIFTFLFRFIKITGKRVR